MLSPQRLTVTSQMPIEGCRICCDLMQLFFIFDEHSDIVDATVVRRQADSIMAAIRDPTRPRPEGEWIGGEISRQ